MKINKINIFKLMTIAVIALSTIITISCSKDQETTTPVPTPKVVIKIGDQFAGGIVYFVEPNDEHGLMAYQSDLVVGGTTFENAIALCENFQTTVGGDPKIYDDWYLPTVVELQKLYFQRLTVGGFLESYYWSSQKDINDIYVAYYVDFYPNQGGTRTNLKTQKFNVRPIRKF